MKILPITDRTFAIDTGMTHIPFYKLSPTEIIMLDTGWASGERKALNQLLDDNHLSVRGMICTHAHIDHIGNAAFFKAKDHGLLAMPEYEALICRSSEHLKTYYYGQNIKQIEAHYGHMACDTDMMITEKQHEIVMLGETFKIVHTPGHSPDHIVIITPDNVAYVGDALISYEVMKSAKLPYAYILSQDLKSKALLKEIQCDHYIVAHKGIYTDIQTLIQDNIDFYKSRAQGVFELMEGEMTHEDIMKKVIKEWDIKVKSIYKYLTVERMLRSYVEYLNETDRIEVAISDGFLKYKKSNV